MEFESSVSEKRAVINSSHVVWISVVVIVVAISMYGLHGFRIEGEENDRRQRERDDSLSMSYVSDDPLFQVIIPRGM
jgi:hypothetical protein